MDRLSAIPSRLMRPPRAALPADGSRLGDALWLLLLLVVAGYAAWHVAAFTRATLSLADLLTALELGLLTLARVVVLIALASVVWVPIGIWIGLRPRVADLRAAGGAVPGGLSGQRAVPDRRRRHRFVASQSRTSG